MGILFGKPTKKHEEHASTAGTTTHAPGKSKAKANVSEKDHAVLELKNTRDRLRKYKKKLESDSDKLTEQAKAMIKAGHKDRALLTLKFKKHKEQVSNNIDDQLLSILTMIEDIDWESTNIKVLEALKSGTAALNRLHNEMSLADVEKLLDDTNEAIEVENEINRVLAQQFDPINDEELENELNNLMGVSKQSVDSSVPTKAPVQLNLPEAPTDEIVVQIAEEDHASEATLA